jgi:hypothetical protein
MWTAGVDPRVKPLANPQDFVGELTNLNATGGANFLRKSLTTGGAGKCQPV